jgi:hypothetical protein
MLDAASPHSREFPRNQKNPPGAPQAGLGIVFEVAAPHGECRVTAVSAGGAARAAGVVQEVLRGVARGVAMSARCGR